MVVSYPAEIAVAAIIFAFERHVARMKELQGALTQSTTLSTRLAVQQDDLGGPIGSCGLEYW